LLGEPSGFGSHYHSHQKRNFNQELRRILIDYFFFLSGRCVKADAATALVILVLLERRKTFDASFPTRLDVFSFFAIRTPIIMFISLCRPGIPLK
jgi:hypothetical protein